MTHVYVFVHWYLFMFCSAWSMHVLDSSAVKPTSTTAVAALFRVAVQSSLGFANLSRFEGA